MTTQASHRFRRWRDGGIAGAIPGSARKLRGERTTAGPRDRAPAPQPRDAQSGGLSGWSFTRRLSLFAAVLAALVLASCKPSLPAIPESIQGNWQGTITIDGRNLGIIVHLNGGAKPTLDIPSQHAYALVIEKLKVSSSRVSFNLLAGSDVATFRGTRKNDVISGDFAQGGHVGTFTITRTATARAEVKQAVADETPVTLRTPTGNISGSLIEPPGKGPFPVILIISGAGAMDRNGNIPSLHAVNNCLLLLAEALKREGFATVRYDKRGVGASAAALPKGQALQFQELISDATGWITSLKKNPTFSKVGVIGYDEGSLVGMAAAEQAKAGAFVSLEGAAMPEYVTLKAELSSLPRSIRVDGDRIISELQAGRRVANVPPSLETLLGPAQQPFLMSKFRYNPLAEIARMTMPVLILQGTEDMQLPVGTAEELHKALPGSYLDLVGGMNHVLKVGSPNRNVNQATYTNPDLPLDPELVQVLSQFLKSVLVPISAH